MSLKAESSGRLLVTNSAIVGVALALSTILRMGTTVLSARLADLDDFGTYTTVSGAAALISAIAMGGWPSYLIAVVPKFGLSRALVSQMTRGLASASAVWILAQSVFLVVALEGDDIYLPVAFGALLTAGLVYATSFNEAQRSSGNVIPSRFAIALVPPLTTALTLGLLSASGTAISSYILIGAHAAGWGMLWLWAARALRSRYAPEPEEFPIVSRRDLFITKLCQSFLTTSDVVIVGWLLGPQPAALYAVASRIAVAVGLGNTAVAMAIGPELSRKAGDPSALRWLVKRMTAMGFGITVLLAAAITLLRSQILPHFGSAYIEASGVLVILVLGVGANALCGPVSLLTNVTGQEYKTRRTLVVATAIYSIVMPLACHLFGVTGAAWARAATTLGWNVALWLQVDLTSTHRFRPRQGLESCT